MTCDKLTVFRDGAHGPLLSGAGSVRLGGLTEIREATCDEFIFDTQIGQMKLTGHVRIEGTHGTTTQNSVIIGRTGQVSPGA